MKQDVLKLNGRMGEGGGQVLRAALALSMHLGRPFEVCDIRAGRAKPGLKRQHLACVKAAKMISDAAVEGDSINSSCLSFTPGKVKAGAYTIEIGSGGSATLLLQAILPPLLTADADSELTVVGGTHVPMAPIYEFFAKSLVGRLNKMGPQISARLERPGFMMVGGGVVKVDIKSAEKLLILNETSKGKFLKINGFIKNYNLAPEIAQREEKILTTLRCHDFKNIYVRNYKLDVGIGNVVYIELEYQNGCTIASGIAEKGLSAEKVARQAVNRIIKFVEAGVPVDRYLADQLVVPIFMAGKGSFVCEALSLHTQTVLEVASMFTEIKYKVSPLNEKAWLVEIGS